jgi:hypothetical protein
MTTALPRALIVVLLGLFLVACSSADASYSAGSGFTHASRLTVLDSTETGKALETELFAHGFNVLAGTKGGPAAQAEPQYIARLIVRRTWRGVLSGTVPGTVSVTISDAKTGVVVATAQYVIGSMSYNNSRDAVQALVAALESKMR